MTRRIAVLEPMAHIGGAEISLLELVRRLDGNPEVVVILPEEGPLSTRVVAAGAEVRILEWPSHLLTVGERGGLRSAQGVMRAARASTSVPALARRISRLLDELAPDMLLTNGIKPHVIGALAQLRSTRPLVWYLRDGLEGRRLSKLAMTALGSRCRGAIAISHYVAEESRDVLPRSVPIRVIYNIVDFMRFRRGIAPPADLVKHADEVWFAMIGPVTALKGHDVFLRAAALVATELPGARFVIVGSNFYRTEAASTYQQRLRSLAEAPALTGRVSFLGHREDIPAILQSVDVFVQPNSGPEALGRSVIEAMACGVPVIVSDRWGPAELVRDGVTGLLSPVLDVPCLAANMIELGRDAARREALGAAAADWVRSALEPQRIVDEFRTFIEGCAE